MTTPSTLSIPVTSASLAQIARAPHYSAITNLDVIPVGAHVVQPGAFGVKDLLHHALYMGNHKVVHYYGDPYIQQSMFGKDRSSVRIDDIKLLQDNAKQANTGLFIHHHPHTIFSAEQAVQRALSRLGEKKYNLLNNNCEHLVYWTLYNTPYSIQAINI